MENLHKVWDTRALKRKPQQEEAKRILDRIAKQVQPIMRKHKWRVKVLSEMFPKRRELLGLNVGHGIEVKLRLRRHDRETEFLSFHEVLDTMLHELCHNAHGPHNASFYKLWDELRKECEELMSKGIMGTGEGFDAPGRRLGGFSRQPPLSSLSKTTLASAENRKRLNSLLPSGPLRLGGDKNIMSALSPMQAAAMAAERRLQDEIWCASVSGALDAEEADTDLFETVENCGPCTASNNSNALLSSESAASQKRPQNEAAASRKRLQSEATASQKRPQSEAVASRKRPQSEATAFQKRPQSKAAAFRKRPQSEAVASQKRPHSTDTTNFIDLSDDVNTPSLDVHDAKSIKKANGSLASSSSTCISNSAPGLTTNHIAENQCGDFVMWTCETCTLLNPPLAPVCEACETLKPKDVSVKYNFWSCTFCTLENSIHLEKCSACGEWRYSRGPPLSTRPPNLGT